MKRQRRFPKATGDAACTNCKGYGYIVERGFFSNNIRVNCTRCNGTGERIVQFVNVCIAD